MAIKCRLFGHDFGKWKDRGEKREFVEDVLEDGVKIGEDVYSIRSRSRHCKRCKNYTETDEKKQKKEERRIKYDIPKSELPPKQIQPANSLRDAEERHFLSDLKGFVQSEMQTEREQKWDEHVNIGIDAAIRRGIGTGPFISMGDPEIRDGQSVYWFRFVEDDEEKVTNLRTDEDFYEDNIYIADSPDLDEKSAIEVEVKKIRSNTIGLAAQSKREHDSGGIQDLLQDNEVQIYLSYLQNPVPYRRRLDALQKVENQTNKRRILTGNRPVSFTSKYPAPDPVFDLNEFQQKALVWADCADDLMLIHGPPGTGKTRTLTAYIIHAVNKGKSVLITAHSNQAVDNLVAGDSTVDDPEQGTLHAIAQSEENDLSISRVGDHSQNPVIRQYYNHTNSDYADVVAATTSGASEFDSNEFDIAVVDEATQASRPSTAIVLNCAKKVVLAGDHKQLPPFSANEEMQEKEMHISLFEHLLDRYGDEITVLLKRQYRMHEAIAEFPNVMFYEGQLETADQNRDWLIDDVKPLMGINISGGEQQREGSRSYYNAAEAEAVAKQIKLFTNSGLDPADIGVISAYKDQIQFIEKELSGMEIENLDEITVDTVDSFQGGEREAIIVSFVRSNNRGNSGFLDLPDVGPRRLNVALTRARKRLVVVGDWGTLDATASHKSENDSCASLYADLAEYIRSLNWMLEQ